jgi:ATP-binding cassette subfamily C protein LapB
VIVPLVIIFGMILQPIIKRMSELSLFQGKSKQAVMVEMIGALETVKMTQGNSMLRNRWLNSVLSQGKTSAKTKMTSQLASHFAQFGQQASQIGIVVYGVFLISAGNLSMGQLIACVILSGRTMAPLGQITGLLGRMNQARSAFRGLDEVLGVKTQEETRANFVSRPNLAGDITFKNVTFTYEDQPDPVLHDLNLEIKAGQKIAILGRIGSGKTSLLRLICGLHPPDKGVVLLDNADIRQIRPEDVRKNIGTVLQNPILFSGTIRDNLLMGKPDATDEELIYAAKVSGADAFIGLLPGGFDFPLSERGQELSSGMRQAIAIARAMIAKPNILLMDEPTASMDNATESQLVDRLLTATTDTTCVFVTHRGAMLKMADHIIVMEKGQIVLAGPRDKVLEKMQGAANG